MPKPRARWFLLVSVLSVWMLSGCITTLAPVRPLPREALASVTEVALAVGADGVKHYAWTECSGENATYTCVLVYSRVAMGGVIYSHGFVTPIGTFAQNPDVAVSSSGDAYVVRSECTAAFNCVDYWSMFPANHPENVQIDTQLLHISAVKSEAPPLVEARGNNVYAAYFVKVSGYVRLRYRQLSGGARTGFVDTGLLPPSSPTLGIDSAGDLHAVWVRNPVADTFIAYSNNKSATGDFNAAVTFESGFNHVFSRPDLALDNNNRVYLAYAIYDNATVKVRCVGLALNCYRGANSLTVPEVDGAWIVYRNPNLELINGQPNLVFAATNNSVVHNEVWWYRPPSTGLDAPPQQVSHTANDSEGEPLIVKEHSTAGDVPVLGWRIFRTVIAGTQAPAVNSGVLCWGDVFTTFSSPSNIRQVFEDQDTCDNAGFDLAASGPWVAGVWVDEESNQIASHAAWTAFNAYELLLPLVKR